MQAITLSRKRKKLHLQSRMACPGIYKGDRSAGHRPSFRLLLITRLPQTFDISGIVAFKSKVSQFLLVCSDIIWRPC